MFQINSDLFSEQFLHVLKNLLKTDEVINDMKDSIKRNLDAQLEIQRKTRQTLQGYF